jgi:hypothetical protein
MRLAHGWQLQAPLDVSPALVREFIRPAIRAVPPAMARRLGPCRIALAPDLGADSSRWDDSAPLGITIAAAGAEPHDVAMELLLCLGQALWEKLGDFEMEAWWALIYGEIRAGVAGEVDEEALAEKRRLLANRASARSPRRLEDYGAAAFASTAAEYVHSLWHDVTVREGPQHLPAPQLRRRLELLARWFPPGPGYKLFPG